MSNQGKDDDIAESITQYQLAEHIMKTISETNALVKMLFKNSSEQKSTKHAAITYEQAENIIKSTHETNALMKRILAQTVPSSRKKLRFDDDSETNNTTTHDNFTEKSDDDPTDNDFISNATSSPAKPPFKPKNHLKQDISARKTSSPTQHDIQLDIISAATSSPPQHEDLVLSTHNKSKKVLHVVDCKDNELEVKVIQCADMLSRLFDENWLSILEKEESCYVLAHIHDKIDFTVAIFVVHEHKVLVVHHRQLDKWLPLGGHIELDEDPEAAALREAREESGFEVELIGERPPTTGPGTRALLAPRFLDIHRISPTHEHIGMIYWARPKTAAAATLSAAEHHAIRWCSREDLDHLIPAIAPAVKWYCEQALKEIGTHD